MTTLLGDVRQERHLSRALHRRRYLDLMPPAGTGDAARADLSLLGDVPPQLGDVLVVDLGHLVAAEVTALAPARRGRRAHPSACRLLGGHQNGMSSSAGVVGKSSPEEAA